MIVKSLLRRDIYNNISPNTGFSALAGFVIGIIGFLISYVMTKPFLGVSSAAVILTSSVSVILFFIGFSLVEGHFISKELNKWRYIIHEDEIEVKKTRSNEDISFNNIDRLQVNRPFLQRFFNTGNLKLSTSQKEVELEYLSKPDFLENQLRGMIREDIKEIKNKRKTNRFNDRISSLSLKPNVGAGITTNLFITLIIAPIIFIGVFGVILLASTRIESINEAITTNLLLLISSIGSAAIVSNLLISDYIGLKSTNYTIKRDFIKRESRHQDEEFLCKDIENISMTESRIESLFGVGTIKISLRDGSSFSIRFIEEPERNLRKVRNLLNT
ncbi:PH domain-containing protein [Candidatus Nanohalobium constans]|nr:PH domain-containing protein [Candidatus Nanohalobium constans]